MKHLVIETIPRPGEIVTIEGDQFHYLIRVRRLRPGDTVRCTDGKGTVATLRVLTVGDGEMNLSVEGIPVRPATPAPSMDPAIEGGCVSLWLALLKGKKFDTVIRQVTEIGVDRICPIMSRNCVSTPGASEQERKGLRWGQIVKEAAQQSGRTILPEVREVMSIKDVPASDDYHSISFLFHEKADQVFPGEIGEVARDAEWRCMVGPEGGFTPEEVDELVQRGWRSCRLPFPVLRAETAALVTAALVQYIRRDYTARSAR